MEQSITPTKTAGELKIEELTARIQSGENADSVLQGLPESWINKIKESLSPVPKASISDIPRQYQGMKSDALQEIWAEPNNIQIRVEESEEERSLEINRRKMIVEELRRLENKFEPKNEDTVNKKEIPTPLSQTEYEKINTVEGFSNLPNVKLCEERLISILNSFKDGDDFSGRASKTIYEMLTYRSEFIQNTVGSGKDVASLMEGFKTQKDWYRNTRELIEKTVDSGGDMKWESNPGWFGINTRPEVPKRDDINIKVYATIPTKEYSFIKDVPALAKELRALSLDSDDIIQVKIPESLSGFMAHNDSVVIHFKKKENAERIQNILNSWTSTNGIHESPREMDRTKVASDSKDSSFSQIVSNNVAGWLQQNIGKLDNTTLVNKAIEQAIKQSQHSPV